MNLVLEIIISALIIAIVILGYLYKEKLEGWSKKAGKYINKGLKKLLNGIDLFFNDIDSHWTNYFFVSIMFVITIIVFSLYEELKEVITGNFGGVQWISTGIFFYLILFFVLLFIGVPLMVKNLKFFFQYIFFPAILFVSLLLVINNNINNFVFAGFVIILFGIYYYTLRYTWKSPNKKILITSFIILVLLVLGIVFVNNYTGEKKINFSLNNCYGNLNEVGEIKCGDLNNQVITGYEINCKVLGTNYVPDKGIVSFTFFNGSKSNIYIYKNQSFSFIIPENLSYLYFEFKNNETCLSVGYPIRYPNYEEFKSDKTNFMYMILALFGFCLISVPIIVKNFYGD